jgi:hypothetical protein
VSKGNTFEADLIALIFNGTAIADIAENDGSGPLTNLYVALHTADPGEAGNQQTSEANYGSYARVAVARNSGGWTCAANQATNTADIVFPECSSGSNTITHVSIGTVVSATGKILYSGSLTTPLAVSAGIEPRFPAGDLTVTED